MVSDWNVIYIFKHIFSHGVGLSVGVHWESCYSIATVSYSNNVSWGFTPLAPQKRTDFQLFCASWEVPWEATRTSWSTRNPLWWNKQHQSSWPWTRSFEGFKKRDLKIDDKSKRWKTIRKHICLLMIGLDGQAWLCYCYFFKKLASWFGARFEPQLPTTYREGVSV